MDYSECLDYLRRVGNEVLGMRFGLETIRSLLRELGDPHLKCRSVLIAGTNGKGSVARFLQAVLVQSGLRSGLYTSPHLVRVNERFLIGTDPISDQRLAACFSDVVKAIETTRLPAPPTYFELLTAVAFHFFAREEVEIVVLEVGMGGRLDSTNVAPPLLSILTPIGMDHQKFLGERLDQIAGEKAGIIHPGRPVLTSRQQESALRVIETTAGRLEAPLVRLDDSEIWDVDDQQGRYRFRFRGCAPRLRAYGFHQVENAALALRAAELLKKDYPKINLSGSAEAVSGVLPAGNLHKIGSAPDVFLDGGHNPDAARILARFVDSHSEPPRSLVFGAMRDKDISGMLKILGPRFQHVFLTRVDSPRSAGLEELQAQAPQAIPVGDPLQALERAGSEVRSVFVTGSLYLVGAILKGKGIEPGTGDS